VDALIISADDYGYAPEYDRGILEAAAAGAIDAVSAFAVNAHAVASRPLIETGVEVGIHLDMPRTVARVTVAQVRDLAERQLELFERSFGRPPAFLDGHHHCHASAGHAATVGQLASARDLPVRSVDAAHRRLLRSLGVPTPDLLIGRLSEDEPALPVEIRALLTGQPGPPGVVEWMVHPGRASGTGGSSYDRGREEDLELLLGLREELPLRRVRATHAVLAGG
jgi:predicted glycoside hydrolase/deacetylase ChbG (UPF0249 family)